MKFVPVVKVHRGFCSTIWAARLVPLSLLWRRLQKKTVYWPPDLPGHGASDLRLDKDLDFITGTSGVVQGLVSDYRMTKVNVLAFGESAALAIELARQTADLVQRGGVVKPHARGRVFERGTQFRWHASDAALASSEKPGALSLQR